MVIDNDSAYGSHTVAGSGSGGYSRIPKAASAGYHRRALRV
jgi:hypothetical protein